ncbi:DUF6011 domain-containing protein [Polymorphospora rubra]|uniref:Uncharacterized protein n=1 Tax=Polymorphospora rubra TaxID=338584 RepID=A0A810N013_9ACTN|nr:DUF6011 domain-containing protein [Polymorphospora rubra]BCJ65133.1 hypothetical protein Prubr_21540 [Polymorphospora rubra]
MTAPSRSYYAVPDPADPTAMTYWRTGRRGLAMWPPKARYGPLLFAADVPPGLKGLDREAFIRNWAATVRTPWQEAVNAAIEIDPDGCAAMFAVFMTRCCYCGRRLTDPESKAYGIGPECRRGVPAPVLAAMANAVGRAHGLHVQTAKNARPEGATP